MTPMDVKGLNWVGNVYQKFEAMCLEVEEIMYQDTLKYVENQVETVGASFKRFYSDVMEDLVPPPDNSKEAGESDSAANTGRSRKLKTGIRNVPSRLAVKKDSDNSEVATVVHENVGQSANLHRRRNVNNLFANSSGDFAKGVSSNLFSRKTTDDCLCLNSNPGLKGKPQKDSQGERLGATLPLKKNSSTSSSLSKFSNDTREASNSHTIVSSIPASIKVTGCDSFQKKSVETEEVECNVSDISDECSPFDVIGTVKLAVEKEREIRSPHDNVPETSTDGGICATNTEAATAYLLEDGDALCRVSSDEAIESSAGRLDDQCLDVEASYMTITNQVREAIQHDVEVDLEECVVVDEEELLFVPYKDGKQKVHKKGIRKILSSRKNSERKQEYEQLAKWYGKGGVLEDSVRENPAVSGKEIQAPPPSDEVGESEWELL